MLVVVKMIHSAYCSSNYDRCAHLIQALLVARGGEETIDKNLGTVPPITVFELLHFLCKLVIYDLVLDIKTVDMWLLPSEIQPNRCFSLCPFMI